MEMVTVPQGGNGLKLFFSMMEDEDITEETLVQWISNVGKATGKQDIVDESQGMADHLQGTKGYTTGEDYTNADMGDLEEARANADLQICNVAIKTLHQYMANKDQRTTAAPAQTLQYKDYGRDVIWIIFNRIAVQGCDGRCGAPRLRTRS